MFVAASLVPASPLAAGAGWRRELLVFLGFFGDSKVDGVRDDARLQWKPRFKPPQEVAEREARTRQRPKR